MLRREEKEIKKGEKVDDSDIDKTSSEENGIGNPVEKSEEEPAGGEGEEADNINNISMINREYLR